MQPQTNSLLILPLLLLLAALMLLINSFSMAVMVQSTAA
jgi:hypothetical protein